MTKSIIKILCFILAIMLGVFMFIYGGYDDSPGGQGVGLIFVIIGIIGLIRRKKKTLFVKKNSGEGGRGGTT